MSYLHENRCVPNQDTQMDKRTGQSPLSLYLLETTKNRFKSYCDLEGISMTEFITACIDEALGNNKDRIDDYEATLERLRGSKPSNPEDSQS